MIDMLYQKLNIKAEIKFNNKYFYIDDNNDWYKLNDETRIPYSPVVNFKRYCQKNMFEKLEGKELISELEKIISEEELEIKLR